MTRALVLVAVVAAGCVGPSLQQQMRVQPQASSAFDREMTFYVGCASGKNCVEVIYAIGEITLNTPARFAAVQAGSDGRRLAGGFIVFDSPGGNLMGSLQLGEAIRQGGWNTMVGMYYVPPDKRTAEDSVCASACV